MCAKNGVQSRPEEEVDISNLSFNHITNLNMYMYTHSLVLLKRINTMTLNYFIIDDFTKKYLMYTRIS